jgi:hypothetical protein
MSSNANKIVLTTQQLLDAHAAHGNDFIEINFESTRKYKNFAQYIDVDIRLPKGKLVPVRYWKLSNEGLIVGSRIKKPEQRKYESIRMGIKLCDDEGTENENAKALKLLCDAFDEKMKQLKTDDMVTDNPRLSRKQADGTYRPFHLISTKVVTPMQTTALDKETGDPVDLENPFFWLSIPKKKFFTNETAPPSVHFNDKYYVSEDGQPDMERPLMTHLYAPDFYNIDDFYHHPRTGKKIYNKLGDRDDETGTIQLDNTNIQNHLTRGSALIGNLKFEVAVSGRQCKLDIALYGRFYVKVQEEANAAGGQDDEVADAFASRYASLAPPKQATNDNEDECEDFEDDDE